MITEALVPPLSAFLRPELDPAALHGLPGEVAVTLAASSGADPAAVLMTFLAMAGNASGPQPHAWFGGAQHPGRLFVVLVGDAATGRKGTALGAVEALFAEADPQWADERVLHGLQSAEAMIDNVADGRGDCRLLIAESEFARLVTTMARSGTFSAQLRNAWDGRALQRTGVRRSQKASRAHVSLLGMITPEELLRHHHRLSQAGGLESRILYAYAAPAAEVSPFAEPPASSELAARVEAVLESSREAVMSHADPVSRYLLAVRGIQPRVRVPVAPEVAQGWSRRVKPRLPVPGEGMAGLHSRAEAQVIRLAGIYAICDLAAEIGPEHVEAAVAAWSYCARSAEVVFSVPVAALPPRSDPRVTARIVRFLHDRYPGWAARDEIGAALHGTATDRALTAALGGLAARGLTDQRQAPAGDEIRLARPPQLTLPFPATQPEEA
jgi:Protein of unknown function (DUF3987)